MVDILPSGPSAVARAPDSKVGADAFQRTPLNTSIAAPSLGDGQLPAAMPGSGLGAGLQQLSRGLEGLAVPFAQQQAASDVAAAARDPNFGIVRDANGMPQAVTPQTSFILGQAGEAYRAAQISGMQAALSSKVSRQITDIRNQNPNDPQGFVAGASAYAETLRSAYGGVLGNALANQAHDEATQHYGGMVDVKARLSVAADLQSITTNIDDTTNQMRALARQGAIDTPVYNELRTKLQDGYTKLGSNALFGYSPDKIASDQAHASAILDGEYIVGQVDSTYTRQGKAAALAMIKEKIDNAPNVMSDAERTQLKNFALSRLDYLSQAQQSNIAALRPTIDLQMKALQAGNAGPGAVSEQELDQTTAQLQSLGAFKEAQELLGARIAADRTIAFRNLAPNQKAAALLGASSAGVGGPIASGVNSEQGAMQYFQSQGWTSAQAAGIVGNLIHESGGKLNPGAVNPGDGSDGSDSIGIGQWNSTRAAALKEFAAAQGKPVTDFGTQLAFVQHELTTSESGAATQLKAAQTPQDAAAAFALGYERPQGFQTGDLSKVAGGQNRLDQTMRLASGGGSSSGSAAGGSMTPGVTTLGGQPYTDAEATQNPWLRTAYRQQIQIDDATQIRFAKAQAETLQNSIKFTGTPSPDIIGPAAIVLQIADRFPDQLGDVAANLRGAIAGHAAGFAAAGSADGGAKLLSDTEDLVRQSPGDRLGLAVGENLKAGIEQGRKQLADDQFGYAHQAEWIPQTPPQINPDDPAQMQQSMNARGVMATTIASHQRILAVSAFSKNELPQIKDIIQNGSVDQKVGLMSAITNAGMPAPILKATLNQLGQDPATSPFAVAGDVARSDPMAARGILEGQALKAANPKLVPDKEIPNEFAQALPFNDLPDGPMRQAYGTTIEAYYAKLSAAQGDTNGILDANRLDQAIKAVTGGVVEWRGGKAIAPWHGATQDQFDTAIRSVTDADLANSRGTDGIPLPASYLRPSLSGALSSSARWRLESYGDGKYLVYAGPDDHDQRQYLQDTMHRKFVLDLGAKRAQVEAAPDLSMPSSTFYESPLPWYEMGSPTGVAR